MSETKNRVAVRQDAYVPLPEHGLTWASQNRRTLVLACAAVLLAIVVLVIAGVVYNNRSEKASEAFGAAMQTYQTPLAAPGQQVPPGVKTFPDPVTRANAASKQFLQVADQYGMTPDGKNARYFAGLTYVEAGQNASAEATLKQVAGGWNHDLASLSKLALAQLYRQTGRDAQAVELYNALAAKPTNAVSAGTAKLQLASLYEGENKPELARKVYAELKDQDAKGAAGAIAAQKLNPSAAPAGAPPQM